MNNLFTSIQQNLQQNNQNSLLQNQKINQDKINELLEVNILMDGQQKRSQSLATSSDLVC